MESTEMSILNILHDGAEMKREDIVRQLEVNHSEVGQTIDHLWIRGLLKAKGLDIFSISPAGLEGFNEEMMRDA
jgi:hypothetical protein